MCWISDRLLWRIGRLLPGIGGLLGRVIRRIGELLSRLGWVVVLLHGLSGRHFGRMDDGDAPVGRRHQGATSSGPEARTRAAAADQDNDKGDCDDPGTDVCGTHVANVVAVAVGGALGAHIFHVIETISGTARIRQAPGA